MTADRAIELLRGMQSSIVNGGRLRSASHTLDDSRVKAMDVAIEAIRSRAGNETKPVSEASRPAQSEAP